MTSQRLGTPASPVRRTAVLAALGALAIATMAAPAVAGSSSAIKHSAALKLKVVSSPSNPGTAGTFDSVSCPGASSCFAVGEAQTGSGVSAVGAVLIDHWDGTRWWPLATPPATDAVLSGVSCPTTSFCLAVGNIERGTTENNNYFAEKWSGGQWSVASPPGIASTDDGGLEGVTCLSSKDCTAVGDFSYTDGITSDTDTVAVIEHFNGHSWSSAKVTGPASTITDTQLYGVSCASTSWCVAAGYNNTHGVVLTSTNQTTWKAYTKLAQPTRSTLFGVACVKPRSCIAVGADSVSDTSIGQLVETGVGANFKRHILDLTSTTKSVTSPLGVACRTANDCLLADYYVVVHPSGGVAIPFAQVWNGHTLTTVHTQQPSGWADSTTQAAAVHGSTFWLVGDKSTSVGVLGEPLAERS